MESQIQLLIFSFLFHPEFEIPGISVNTSIAPEDVDSVAALCHTNNTEVQWYVAHTLESSSEHPAISPDTKTVIIKRVKNYDLPLQCGVKIVLGTVIQRSELIYLTMACEWSGVMRGKPRVTSGFSKDMATRQAELVRVACDALQTAVLGSNPRSGCLDLCTSELSCSDPWFTHSKMGPLISTSQIRNAIFVDICLLCKDVPAYNQLSLTLAFQFLSFQNPAFPEPSKSAHRSFY